MVKYAYVSQKNKIVNSNRTLTYSQVCDTLVTELGGMTAHVEPNSKYSMKMYGNIIKDKCVKHYKIVYRKVLDTIQINDSKLSIYSKVKKEFCYNNYLDVMCYNTHILTKFRMSVHWLHIERGRYTKPKTPREDRLCIVCK